MLAVSSAIAEPTDYFDDFSSDTTGNYETYDWQLNHGTVPTVDVVYNASLEEARLTATGGYSQIVMTQKNCYPISPGMDFEFSVDLAILNEFNSAIYLGDLRSLDTSDHLLLHYETHEQHSGAIHIISKGQVIFEEPTNHAGSMAHLKIRREDGTYSFFIDDNLEWQMEIPEFDGLSLHYGIWNSITSGPSGVTATTAVDNWSFTVVPEPATLGLLAVGGLTLFRRHTYRI